MPRGTKITRPLDRQFACANCDHLRKLIARAEDRCGRTGSWFCSKAYRETGDFEDQPWDFTCEDWVRRRSWPLANAPRPADSVRIVYELEGAFG